jgi:hypothetical protein
MEYSIPVPREAYWERRSTRLSPRATAVCALLVLVLGLLSVRAIGSGPQQLAVGSDARELGRAVHLVLGWSGHAHRLAPASGAVRKRQWASPAGDDNPDRENAQLGMAARIVRTLQASRPGCAHVPSVQAVLLTTVCLRR